MTNEKDILVKTETPHVFVVNGQNVYSAEYMKSVLLKIINQIKHNDEFYVLTHKKEQLIYGNINIKGELCAQRVYNAVYNDYAEFFERGEDTEPGDIIAIDEQSESEQYIKATKDSACIVGVHSNSFAFLIGGTVPDSSDKSLYDYNITKFIPVGLCGRVFCKLYGHAKIGDYVVISDNLPGVGVAIHPNSNTNKQIIGRVLQVKHKTDVELVKILIK